MDRIVLEAAIRLLEARDALMLTAVQWDSLHHAVNDATTPTDCTVTFLLQGDTLVEVLTPTDGGPPVERECSGDVYRHGAEVIDVFMCKPFLVEELRDDVNGSWEEAAVMVAFLKSKGWLKDAGDRRVVATSDDLYERIVEAWATLKAEESRG